MGLQQFERRLERLVEGAFAKAFRSTIRPVELGRRLTREMDQRRTVGVRGEVIAPNQFDVAVSPTDHESFASFEEALVRELGDAAREHARSEGYTFLGPVTVVVNTDAAMRTGQFELTSEIVAAPGGRSVGSIVLPDGPRFAVGDDPLTIGRLPECDIVLSDASVSRRHAEIRRQGEDIIVVDLDSTNGTKVNGTGVKIQALRDGDEISVGSATLRFEES